MNILNKTLLVISLTLAIPLSTQAHWFGDLTESILGKKKTITAGAVLSAALVCGAIKYTDIMELPIEPLNQEHAESIAKQRKNTQAYSVFIAIWLTGYLIYKAHQQNLFGEKA